jgi:hypothetical protein
MRAAIPEVAGPEFNGIIVFPAQVPAVVRAGLGPAGIDETKLDPAEHAGKEPAARGCLGLDPINGPLPLGTLLRACILRKRGGSEKRSGRDYEGGGYLSHIVLHLAGAVQARFWRSCGANCAMMHWPAKPPYRTGGVMVVVGNKRPVNLV